MDKAIILWVERTSRTTAHRLAGGTAQLSTYFRIIRHALSHYITERIKPYFKIGGAVAIDETLIGRQRWSYLGSFPVPKWAWGLIDLASRIPVIYHCQSKSHDDLVALIKRHVLPGAILYSDSHSSYVTLNQQNRSKLTQYGWYHYWICHMVRYVHEKFGFVHTSAIEMTWAHMKKCCQGMSHMEESESINRYLNTFTFRQIFRKECLHAMIL